MHTWESELIKHIFLFLGLHHYRVVCLKVQSSIPSVHIHIPSVHYMHVSCIHVPSLIGTEISIKNNIRIFFIEISLIFFFTQNCYSFTSWYGTYAKRTPEHEKHYFHAHPPPHIQPHIQLIVIKSPTFSADETSKLLHEFD